MIWTGDPEADRLLSVAATVSDSLGPEHPVTLYAKELAGVAFPIKIDPVTTSREPTIEA